MRASERICSEERFPDLRVGSRKSKALVREHVFPRIGRSLSEDQETSIYRDP